MKASPTISPSLFQLVFQLAVFSAVHVFPHCIGAPPNAISLHIAILDKVSYLQVPTHIGGKYERAKRHLNCHTSSSLFALADRQIESHLQSDSYPPNNYCVVQG